MGTRSKALLPGGKKAVKTGRTRFQKPLSFDFPWTEALERTLTYVEDHPECDVLDVARDVHEDVITCAHAALNRHRNKGLIVRFVDRLGNTRYKRAER